MARQKQEVISVYPVAGQFLAQALSGSPWTLTVLSPLEQIAGMSITRAAGGSVIIAWPAYITGWTLQQATGLDSSTWLPLPAPGNTVTVPTSFDAGFFRLSKVP